jgi:hypothetical protein
MDKWHEKFDSWVKSLSTKQKFFIGIVVLLGVIAIFYPFGWSGFGEDSNVSDTGETKLSAPTLVWISRDVLYIHSNLNL